jgi:hypothetical protein
MKVKSFPFVKPLTNERFAFVWFKNPSTGQTSLKGILKVLVLLKYSLKAGNEF